ncbi:hypothetical protein R50073_06320 [Maricurvus nonylphenolicus]|uniref:hypothetical protein n=1 Tax=Maricurvus nonylphenolicus TaxID=1008307 RepID=UPI0036F42741
MIMLISDIDQSATPEDIESLIHEYCTPTGYEILDSSKEDSSKETSLSVAVDVSGPNQYVEQLAERIDGREWKGHRLHAHPMLFFQHLRKQPHIWHRH